MLKAENLKHYVKQASEKVLRIRYHRISNRIAFESLKGIQKEKGKLNATTKKLSDEYANDVLGWKGFAPWLYVYSAVRGNFEEGWLPDNYYGKVVIPKIQGDYGKISSLKPLCNKLFNAKVTPDVASFINGFWFDQNLRPIASESLQKFIFADTEKVICKLDKSYQGRDIFQFKKHDFIVDIIEKKGNCVVQKYIRQHPFFDAFTATSVATIRITTVVDNDNKISLRACYLRLGRANDTHVKSVNHIRIPINMANGTLYEYGYLANWQTIVAHPDSKVAFKGQTIPGYLECIQLVVRLHEKMPMVRAIGWDLALDMEDNPVVMEWNGYSNDIKFSEATQGPCFKDLNWHRFK
ncbi:sugar-transfer associated ATP-grasp domain-containing protein [Pricia sp.]|uniref:sugar-transfer associated ATP-grasp domain-containing protein n=1 Tax=Pricia sp. TaxID=2268138 RepID=UPI0035931956